MGKFSKYSPQQKNPGHGRVWGRTKGRTLSRKQSRLVVKLLTEYAVKPSSPLQSMAGFSSVDLEIGFGGGEHLLHRARLEPKRGFIGVEPFLNGIAKILAGIDEKDLHNIRLHHGDIHDILTEIPEDSISNIHILFPDPWPKPRHHKRRLIQDDFLVHIHRILKPNGRLRFACDIVSYIDWSLIRIFRHGGFSWSAQTVSDWLTPYTDWPGTRYESKAVREGRTPHYFTFSRV